MKQVVQDIRSGITAVRELPDPLVQPHCLLIANVASLLSVGTERYVVELARQSLFAKARQRPDHVKRVLQKIKQEGLFATAKQVRARLDDPMPLGYSSAGIVLAVGDGVSAFKAGDRVAAAAPHAGVVVVGENLCAKIPDGVTFEQAAYAAVAAVALQGVRLADASLGSRILVIGLGLVGQLAAGLLKANGVAVLGTGRSDRSYEEKGIDYPIGHARWTAKRNMETVLETIASGALPVEKLTTHRFPIDRAAEAYDLMTSSKESLLGVVIDYDGAAAAPLRRRLALGSRPVARGASGISVIGAGNFARAIVLPRLREAADVALRGVCSARGLSAEHFGRKSGFAFAATDPDEVIADADTSIVFILTRHDLHADLVVRALAAGKHVFVEKPLCIRPDELQTIAGCVESLGQACPVLMVGFNRRFAPATARVRAHFAGVTPLSVSYRFATGDVPSTSWIHDPDVGGGRIVGEACHAIDTCVAIVGSPPARVFAESAGPATGGDPLDDRAFITIRHENGSISSISYQAGGDSAGPIERLEVFGGGRTAIVDEWDRIELWSANRRSTARGGRNKGHEAEIDAFLAACRHGGAWPIPWRDIYGTTWASLMTMRSLREGRPIGIMETSDSTIDSTVV